MDKLDTLLKFEAEEISHFFEKASLEGQGTPQEISDRREIVVKKFLEKFFPFPYRIAKGNISDSYGEKSQSIDCIVLNPCHPYTVSNEEKYSIIFADGVDVAIEVKPDLSNEEEIKRSLKQVQSVKKLNRVKHGLVLTSGYNENQINDAKKIPTFIFSNKTYKDIRILIEKIVDFYIKNSIPRNEQFDFIIVNDNFLIINSKKDSCFSLGNLDGIFFCESGKLTISYFLLWLNMLPKCEPTIGSNVINHYIKNNPKDFKQFEDLNSNLLKVV